MPASSIRKKVSEEEAWFTTPTNGNYNLHDKNHKKGVNHVDSFLFKKSYCGKQIQLKLCNIIVLLLFHRNLYRILTYFGDN